MSHTTTAPSKTANPATARRHLLAAALWTTAFLLAGASAAETFSFDSKSLYLGNLIGEVEVVAAGGNDFEVEVTLDGRDAESAGIRFEESSNSLAILFPTGRERYVYPRMGRGRTTIRMSKYDGDSSLLRDLLGAFTGRSVKVSGSGSGLEVWADVLVRVPAGAQLELRHGVGAITANGVDADMTLDISSGGIDASDITGELVVDTGSGNVVLTDIQGNVVADTGSGAVSASLVSGRSLSIDTGSGSVSIADIDTDTLEIDTGSGGVEGAAIRAESDLIDTGSGSVVLEMVDMGNGDFEIDTGSGSITLLVPPSASADVRADTGSGGISVDLPDIETLHRERDEMRFRVGGGDARVRLDTGSGRIRVSALD
ncbi:MAG: DUF4097 family beta strand repeat-containing protein [Acidobacteriota bacterium]